MMRTRDSGILNRAVEQASRAAHPAGKMRGATSNLELPKLVFSFGCWDLRIARVSRSERRRTWV
jgi:hypothetical protein